jgi:hypothetical protein
MVRILLQSKSPRRENTNPFAEQKPPEGKHQPFCGAKAPRGKTPTLLRSKSPQRENTNPFAEQKPPEGKHSPRRENTPLDRNLASCDSLNWDGHITSDKVMQDQVSSSFALKTCGCTLKQQHSPWRWRPQSRIIFLHGYSLFEVQI